MPVERASAEQLDELGDLIRKWAAGAHETNDLVLA
ncbi:MAG: hypothetical protein QOF60_156, partial [Actinomycetota bacterium]|nr:hypothetical protein [Actinomycetota bacterium]